MAGRSGLHLGLDAALGGERRRHGTARDRDGRHGDPRRPCRRQREPGLAAGRVPGCVMDDLWRAGEIADPYVERNSRTAEWVSDRAWTYRRTIEVPPLADDQRAWLRFAGIDGAGHAFLDGSSLGRHDGLFVPFEVEIGDRVRRGGRHELAVVIEPAPESEPQVGRTSKVRVHRPRMSYGWDFCPRLVQQGLWQPVELVTAGPVRIRDVWARAILDDELTTGQVIARVALDRADRWDGAMAIEAELVGGPARQVATARRGDEDVELNFEVDRPALWWPNGEGRAALHRLTVRAVIDGEIVDERDVSIGFRRIERRANEGAAPDARPWTFVVNGRPVEIKGWNWTPIDALYGVPRPDRLGHLCVSPR